MSTVEFKIDEEVPPPKRRNLKLTGELKKLKVGQSIFIVGAEHNEVSSRVSQLRRTQPEDYGRLRVTAELREENGVEGIRIWRLEDRSE